MSGFRHVPACPEATWPCHNGRYRNASPVSTELRRLKLLTYVLAWPTWMLVQYQYQLLPSKGAY